MPKTKARLQQVFYTGVGLSVVGSLLFVLSYGLINTQNKNKFIFNRGLPYWSGIPLLVTGIVGVIAKKLEKILLISLFSVGCLVSCCVSQLVAIATAVFFTELLDAMVAVFVLVALVVLAEVASIVAFYGLIVSCRITLFKRKDQEVILSSVELPENIRNACYHAMQNPCLFQELDISNLGREEFPPDYFEAVRDSEAMRDNLQGYTVDASDNEVPDPVPRDNPGVHNNSSDSTADHILCAADSSFRQDNIPKEVCGTNNSQPVGRRALVNGNISTSPVCPVYSVKYIGSCSYRSDGIGTGACLATNCQPDRKLTDAPPSYPGYIEQ